MGFFKKLFKSDFKYKVTREMLVQYINEDIKISYENNLAFISEFFIKKDIGASDKLHVEVLNYDFPGENLSEIEENFAGVQIFVNNEKVYNPETDKRYSTAESFVEAELADYPEEVILEIVGVDSVLLKAYEIED